MHPLLALCLASPASADRPHHDNSAAYDNGSLGSYPNQTFVTSRLVAPRLNIATRRRLRPARGVHTLLAPRGDRVGAAATGPMLLDAQGRMVWLDTRWQNVQNLRVQEYKLARYLTFWAGTLGADGRGRGYYYMLDSSYKQVLKIRAQDGMFGAWGDHHEFIITKKGTAVLMIYEKKRADLSSVSGGGRRSGWIWDCLFQEIYIDSRKVVFRWRASDFFKLDYSYLPLEGRGTYNEPWDWFHLNSVDTDDAGNYLISARYTNSIAYISGRNGSILWKLGGRHSDFVDKPGGEKVSFAFQHDARWHGNGTISLFDNSADDAHRDGVSRGILISVDTESKPMTTRLVQQFVHPDRIASLSDGNMQVLPDRNVLIGWGRAGAWTEFAPDGTVVEDVRFQPRSEHQTGHVQSYRIYKMPWQGYPKTKPSVVIKDSAAYVSWTGATEVNHWLLQCARSTWLAKSSDWADIVSEEKQGFETVLDFDEAHLKKWMRVVAFDADGNVLGKSRTVDWRFARKPWPRAYSISDPSSLLWYILLIFCLLFVLLRVSRRCSRRFYGWRSSKRRRRNSLKYSFWRKTSPKD